MNSLKSAIVLVFVFSIFFAGCASKGILVPFEHFSDGYFDCGVDGCGVSERIDLTPVYAYEALTGQFIDPSKARFMKYCDYYYLIGPGFFNVWIGQLTKEGIEFEPIDLGERVSDPIFPSVSPQVILQYKTVDGRTVARALKECDK